MRRQPPLSRARREDGFTLMEMMITCAILGILCAVGAGLMTSLFDSQIRQGQMLDQTQSIETYYGFLASRLSPAQRPVGIVNGNDTVDPRSIANDQFVFQSMGLCTRVFWIGPVVPSRPAASINQVRATIASSCTASEIKPVRGPNQAPAADSNGDGFAEPGDPDFDLAIDSLAPNWNSACLSYNGGASCTFAPVLLASGIVQERPPYAPQGTPAQLVPFAFINDSGSTVGGIQQFAGIGNPGSFYNSSSNASAIASIDVTAYIRALASTTSARVSDRFYTQNISLQQVCAIPGGSAGTQAGGDLTGAYPAPQIKTGAVDSSKVADDSLTANDLGPSSVGNSEIGTLPAGKAYLSSTQSLTTGNNAVISFNAEAFDYASPGIWASSAPTRMTAPVAGLYAVDASLGFSPSNAGLRLVLLRKNGGAVVAGAQEPESMGILGATSFANVSALLKLNAGDYIEVIGMQNSGGSLTVGGAETTSISMNWVSRAG